MTYLQTVSRWVDDNIYNNYALAVYNKKNLEGLFSIYNYHILEWIIRQITSAPIIGLDKTEISPYAGELSAIRYAGYYYIDDIVNFLDSKIHYFQEVR